MAEFLNKEKAYAAIVDVLNKATNRVVLITPYIKVQDDLFDRLRHRDRQGIRTVIVCREEDLRSDEKSKLKQLKHLELRFDEDLHAKCFYSEDSMVITSLNLHEYSQQHNREMGILLSMGKDEAVFKEALHEAEFIVTNAKKDSAIKGVFEAIGKEAKSLVDSQIEDIPKRTRKYESTNERGFCIRCGKSKSYDVSAPYCLDCYRVWDRYKNPGHKEKYCHSCGKLREQITMAKPLCIPCFRKQ